MSSPVAVIELTYGGTDVQAADLGIFLELFRGLFEAPEVRGVDSVVPTRAGRIARDRQDDRLTIELRGLVSGPGATPEDRLAAFAANRQTIRTLFDPKVTRVLEAVLEDGSTATINARTLNRVPDIINAIATRLSIELESVDPNWVIETGS